MLLAKNRKALYNYEIIEKFIAGIVLKGYEVKALREKKAGFEGSYVKLDNGKAVVVGLHIGKYSKQSKDFNEVSATRSRQLLLNKAELLKLERELSQKGKTAVPLSLLLKNNRVKLEFALVKGRKQYEKKHVEKERQIKRDLAKKVKDLWNPQ
ncbi:SsrA-binding protein SmpB [Patescibacteria group bacterium]|nr:SsrA-binding protein SmpB [Patescibacteria group bacterium]